MAEGIFNATDATFQSEVLSSDKPVLVDFWASWCGPCRMLAPTLEEVAKEKGDAVKVVKVDIDQNQKTPAQFGVQSIPTLILFKNGEAVAQKVGNVPKADILKMFDS